MKIGLVVDDTLDKTDGVQQYVLTLGAWLGRQGHEVHYLAGQTKRTDLPNLHSLSRNIAVRFNGNKLTIPLPVSRAHIRQLLAAEQFDVLHVQMPYSPFMAARVVEAAGPKTVIVGTFHILPFSALTAHATRSLGTALRKSLKKFDSVLAVSAAAADFAHRAFKITATVVPNMVDVGHFRTGTPRSSGSPFTIVFLGRLVRRKGVLELLRAVNALPENLKTNLTVKIGGKGELMDEARRYIERHHLGGIVHLHGFVDEAAKPDFLSQADIAVYPSISGESFGIVLLEGMAAGAGVTIGGDNPGYHSVLGTWPETLFDPRDTAAFAQKLRQLMTDAGLRQRLHEQQQSAIGQYDIAVVGAQIQAIYDKHVALVRVAG